MHPRLSLKANKTDGSKLPPVSEIPTWKRAIDSIITRRGRWYLPGGIWSLCDTHTSNLWIDVRNIQARNKDPSLQELKRTVESEWPDRKSSAAPIISPYWNYCDEISTYHGIMFNGEKVIVSKSLQPKMLAVIHSSHLGVGKCKRRARDVVYWPGMNAEIGDVVSKCKVWSTYQRSNPKELLHSHPVPQCPWARVGADLFELNSKTFLIIVDYYSGFIEVEQLRETKIDVII